ncbi:MAG: CAP domain-containing protein [Chloroflexota bacterium]
MLMALQVQPVAAADQDHAADVERVLQLSNAGRQTVGLAPLKLSPQLSAAALSYSQVLADGSCFQHTCGLVPNFVDRLGQAGYTGWSALGENIAAGYSTPDAVVAGWMASAGHRANILSPDYDELGVGVVGGGPYRTYWTQEFGLRPVAVLDAAQLPPQGSGDLPTRTELESASGE